MRSVKPLEIGLMFWADENAPPGLDELLALRLNAGQLGIPGELSLDGASEPWRREIAAHDVAITTAVCSYLGESYADIDTVARTVGLVPPESRKARVERTHAVANFAAEVGIAAVGCHIGFIPHETGSDVYSDMVTVVREICDHCAGHSQSFALETGQEPAPVLLQFMDDVRRPNLGINFDPANLILYGTGNPLEALDLLGPRIVSVHCKDGDPPPADRPGTLGTERRLGDGSVGLPGFIGKLRSIGYTGILSIEREEASREQRSADIRHALKLLKQLTD